MEPSSSGRSANARSNWKRAANTPPVVLGEPGDDLPFLGVVTLEELGVVFDPFRRELRRMTARL
jgi:hypothetical protein